MINSFKQLFGENLHINVNVLEEKAGIALYLAQRTMYLVEMEGIVFAIVEVRPDEKFGVVALKKQMRIYEEKLNCNIAFSFSAITKNQREALLHNGIPFIDLPEQVYLPFLGIILSNRFKKEKQIRVDKMMPATQQLFLFLLYLKGEPVLKSVAADELSITRTSITRASEQLQEMGLIEQIKSGKERYMRLKSGPRESVALAKQYMINPVQSKITINRADFKDELVFSGETALSEYSMLNPPRIPVVAVYKGKFDKKEFKELDVRWADPEELLTIEFWKYDPLQFASSDKVDPVSLACSLMDMEDERVEMAIDEMMEEFVW